MKNNHSLDVGKKVCYLEDYNWEHGTVVKAGPKNLHIKHHYHNIVTIRPRTKCAFYGERVCVVWETWKGVNGRGGYRVEKELYPQYRIDSESVSRQSYPDIGRVTEKAYGVL